jgi:hypothetical protein
VRKHAGKNMVEAKNAAEHFNFAHERIQRNVGGPSITVTTVPTQPVHFKKKNGKQLGVDFSLLACVPVGHFMALGQVLAPLQRT